MFDGIEGGGAALVMSYLNLCMLQDEDALGEALARYDVECVCLGIEYVNVQSCLLIIFQYQPIS